MMKLIHPWLILLCLTCVDVGAVAKHSDVEQCRAHTEALQSCAEDRQGHLLKLCEYVQQLRDQACSRVPKLGEGADQSTAPAELKKQSVAWWRGVVLKKAMAVNTVLLERLNATNVTSTLPSSQTAGNSAQDAVLVSRAEAENSGPTCTCAGGTPATGGSCIANGAEVCGACDVGYSLHKSACEWEGAYNATFATNPPASDKGPLVGVNDQRCLTQTTVRDHYNKAQNQTNHCTCTSCRPEL